MSCRSVVVGPTYHLPVLLRSYESSFFGSKTVRKLQDHQAQGSGSRDLREPQAQTTAGLRNQWLVVSG
jgi:hypothetical protein